ncbi:sigma factor [Actinoplanes sp. NPDC020271]|uniref:sigma factor n=1 Tax=Actinoplanes sp. NPDC020271 TaxID=3363896 RepID=UPI0037903489
MGVRDAQIATKSLSGSIPVFVAASVTDFRPLQTARLLTAGDPHLAEDLVQTALTKLYVSWAAFRRADNPDGYLRRVLVNAFLRERRRSWWRKASIGSTGNIRGKASTAAFRQTGEVVQRLVEAGAEQVG